MRCSSFALACWLSVPAVAAPPRAPDAPPADPVVRVPAAPLSDAEAARRDALTRYGVGLIQARTEKVAQAAKQFQLAADKDPTAAAPLRELAKLYVELGRDPAAVRAASKAVTLDPQDFDTARLLGRLHTEAHKPADAVKAYRLAVDSERLTDPVVKLAVLKELAKAADAAADDKSAEAARRDALKLIADSKRTLLQPDLFTPAELERERVKLYEGLGQALVKRKEYATASAAFETARDLAADRKGANDPAGVARLHWNLSGSLAAQGETTAAVTELEKYLAFRPAAFAPYERFAELYRKLGRGDELPAALARLADADPKNPAPRWVAAAVTLKGEPVAADAAFRRLAGTAASADQFRVLVAAYREAGRAKELLDLLDRTYKEARPAGYDDDTGMRKEKEPDPPPADAVERARLFTAAVKAVPPNFGLTSDLVHQLDNDARNGTDRHPDTLELAGGLATRDGRLGALTEPLVIAARRRPNDYRLKWLAVSALAQQRRWDVLVQEAEVLSKGDRLTYPGIAAQAAYAHAELGRRDDALRRLDGLGGTPYLQVQRARVLNVLAVTTGDPKLHAQALKVCEAELGNDRLSPSELRQVKVTQADTLNLMKRYAESEAVLRELLDADPDDVLALNNLGYHLAEQGRKLDEAEALVRRAVALDRDERARRGDPEADSGGYTDSLGWVLFRRGKLTEARELLEKAAASPESAADAVVWDHLGDAAFRQGDKKRAATAWAKAADLYANTHQGKQDGRLDEVARKRKLVE